MRKILDEESVWIILVVLVVVAAIMVPDFSTKNSAQNILTRSGVIGALAIGSGMVLLSGNLDLSPGSIVALCSVVTSFFMRQSIVLGILVGFCTCLGFGTLAGILVSKAKIPSLMATLGIMGIARSLAFYFSDGLTVSGVKEGFTFLGNGSFLGIPIPIIAVVLGVACMTFLLKYTIWGRNIYATGGNEVSAFYSGIRTDKVKIIIFILASVFYALGGLIYTARISSGTPEGGVGYELDAITTAVLGGIYLFGGRGKLRNILAGALILSVIETLMNLRGISAYTQQVVKGCLFIAVVGLRGFISRRIQERARAGLLVSESAQGDE
jgi:ribose/xylose/arabinose/galactoside ABC-type transport system permease subunit